MRLRAGSIRCCAGAHFRACCALAGGILHRFVGGINIGWYGCTSTQHTAITYIIIGYVVAAVAVAVVELVVKVCLCSW
jgi:hypothetical protein